MYAIPRRFRRLSLLIVGCGDIGMRVARLTVPRFDVFALTSDAQRMPELRSAGIKPILGNLDDPTSLQRIRGLADWVLHLAPPNAEGVVDTRTRHLISTLMLGGRVKRLVYGSTTGVYGDCGGARFDETRRVAPATSRALRRVDAENRLRDFGKIADAAVTVLRIPGIYAADRPGGARERLVRGTPVLASSHDVYTNHVQADDLALICVAALFRGKPQRVIHANDDSDMTMGDYLDAAADMFGLQRPARVSIEEGRSLMTPIQLSFMGESRRLVNTRLKKELRVALRYPTVLDGLKGQARLRSLGRA